MCFSYQTSFIILLTLTRRSLILVPSEFSPRFMRCGPGQLSAGVQDWTVIPPSLLLLTSPPFPPAAFYLYPPHTLYPHNIPPPHTYLLPNPFQLPNRNGSDLPHTAVPFPDTPHILSILSRFSPTFAVGVLMSLWSRCHHRPLLATHCKRPTDHQVLYRGQLKRQISNPACVSMERIILPSSPDLLGRHKLAFTCLWSPPGIPAKQEQRSGLIKHVIKNDCEIQNIFWFW